MNIGMLCIIGFIALAGMWLIAMILFILEDNNKDFEDKEIWKNKDEDRF